MAESYKKAVGGRLKIGGVAVESKKKKKKRKVQGDGDGHDHSGGKASSALSSSAAEQEEEEEEIKIETGTGRLTSSGTIVTGHATNFLNQLKVNDAIMITHPNTLQEETRIVKMVVSNTGMAISSPFSTDLISTTSFRFIRAPEDAEKEDPEEAAKKKRKSEEDQAFGTYSGNLGTKVIYRVKKPGVYGGYKIVTEDAGNQLSRTELLEQRTKHKSDRHAY